MEHVSSSPPRCFSASPVKDDDSPDTSSDDDRLDDAFGDLAALPVEVSERRPTCSRCRRPQKVCLCPFLPPQPLDVSTCLYIVQHPAEESRVLRTVPLLAACLPPGKCNVIVGRRFNEAKNPELAEVCRDSRTLILYPGPNSQNLEELAQRPGVDAVTHNIILIDGTWSQAKNIFLKNSILHLPKQVQLNRSLLSQYVIRTQPSNICLSTLECAAVALSILECNDIFQERGAGLRKHSHCCQPSDFSDHSKRLFPKSAAEATEGPVFLPAGARRSGTPQQGAPAEERHV
ncbi:tRNA-uridine aminocarboxypropyltransferase 2 isoform X1 [Phycodurus eques]|uniref:tRNA-uridine aminocarboxypropyltransferase 2 isoform X1 n=1 Tax=Phycodurus eques TaxID=693459 RepID=UPI002ACE49B9|nr:tRNA-uridine aminocarboxypropyltransferase 2 isoform X1 [Phycodurus eques]